VHVFQPRQAPFEIACRDGPTARFERPGDVARLERRDDALGHRAERRRERGGDGVTPGGAVELDAAAARRRQEAHEAEAQQAGIAAVESMLDHRARQSRRSAAAQRLSFQRRLVAAARPAGGIAGLAFLETTAIAGRIDEVGGHDRPRARRLDNQYIQKVFIVNIKRIYRPRYGPA